VGMDGEPCMGVWKLRNDLKEQLLAVSKDPESPMTKSLLDALQEEGAKRGRQEGREEGREMGKQEGMLKSLRMLLEEKFGALSPAVLSRLTAWPSEGLDQLFRAAVRAQSLKDLGLENGGNGT